MSAARAGGRAGCSEGFTLGSAPRCLPPYTVDEAELTLEGAGYSEIAPAFKLKAPDGVNPFIEWAPVFSAVDGAGRDVDVVFHMSSGDFSELNI